MNLNKVLQLHGEMKTKESDILRSIRGMHGDRAAQAVELQYRLVVLLNSFIAMVSALGAPDSVVDGVSEEAQFVTGEILPLTMSKAVLHIEDRDKALDLANELAQFVVQLSEKHNAAMIEAVEGADE